MNIQCLRYQTRDHIELQGMLFFPEKKSQVVVLHVHGLSGNYYENRFIDKMACGYTSQNVAFMTFNNRGHDYISDLIKRNDNKIKFINGGGAYEIFEECIYDIDASISLLIRNGFKHIYLQGHSTGANKAVYYQSMRNEKKIKGLILLSPCDDIGIKISKYKNNYNRLIKAAKNIFTIDPAKFVVFKGTNLLTSAKTILSFYNIGSKNDVFHYRDADRELKELIAIKVPILVVLGEKDDYLLQGADNVKRSLAKSNVNDVSIVKNASHGFVNKENQLVKVIIKWLTQNNNPTGNV
ncbi:DUF1749 domain-containing protein [candidate division TA06 bacterium]|nr:DUF1749 domain-containing protein [candidate division TA06 bacterium]